MKDGENVGEETESGILFLPSIKRTDAGDYTCRGRNVAGCSDSILSQSSFIVSLFIVIKAIWLI